jgi:hypothetical protein
MFSSASDLEGGSVPPPLQPLTTLLWPPVASPPPPHLHPLMTLLWPPVASPSPPPLQPLETLLRPLPSSNSCCTLQFPATGTDNSILAFWSAMMKERGVRLLRAVMRLSRRSPVSTYECRRSPHVCVPLYFIFVCEVHDIYSYIGKA